MIYGSESYIIVRFVRKYVEATEILFYRSMMCTPLTDKQGNGNILEEANSQKQLVQSGKISLNLWERENYNVVMTGKLMSKIPHGVTKRKDER